MMGDMSEIFRAMTEHKKAVKKDRLDSANPDGWEKVTKYHWRMRADGKTVNYWPSTGLCMIGGSSKRYNINSVYIKSLINKRNEVQE